MSIKRPGWQEQDINPNKKEVVAAPVLSSRMSSQQSGSSPSSSRFLFAPVCQSLPPLLAVPSRGREFGESSLAVLSSCVRIINNEKRAGVYYIALIHAFGDF